MSLIADAIGELIFEVLGALFSRLFHATGRHLISLLTLGRTHIPSGSERAGDNRSDAWAAWVGFLFWLGALAAVIYWALS